MFGRSYSSIPPLRANKKKSEPRIRYLFYMFVLASLTVYFGAKRVDRKKIKTSFGSEKELDEYEQTTGIKRRTSLVSGNLAGKYKFYSVPYVEDNALVVKLQQALEPTKVKIIDPEVLIQQETEDNTRRYSFLLQDLKSKNKPLPSGLITALIRNEVSFYMNTSQGIYDTNFILKNYPRNTNEASKFETDVGYIEKVLVLKNEVLESLPKAVSDRDARSVNDVISYFETVGKADVVESLDDVKV
ncbi:Altered inheritance of mitochondria protein 36, mitochondrial [Yamadazyma tenuis]|uniref:Altered inheritance of mitochondria protein 36, mitochondrial n=1 Tax=Candida tenuis (strain ATCC 10573 / BCRC 21748 / CBS 615 / JCM 9827 / NBRC 10315 / NRRL Y-1498 / VKM Y-70) TaxID=590646 RepID=G3B543_CANTC|nr:uncharacterized protein CANTEDRAFT_106443 [Yamadazyma tenuis ATCC 10573]EGV63134.1 hypothetical protein CANTEDRAFT_106443 [Yamadazyma tenuis ATCC 10573]WEJ97051.1 Altered inheritance of mitochondria protein 36, mitochondrial [Yamadazyma tenuis]